jgi:hypothetical protein
MIVVPLIFTGVGLYLNSIQVVTPVMRSIQLDNNTYIGARIAIHFRDYAINLNNYREPNVEENDDSLLVAPIVLGAGDYVDDAASDSHDDEESLNFQTFIDEISKITEIDDGYDGGFATLVSSTTSSIESYLPF